MSPHDNLSPAVRTSAGMRSTDWLTQSTAIHTLCKAIHTLCGGLFLASLERSFTLESSLFFTFSLSLQRRHASTQLAVGTDFTQL